MSAGSEMVCKVMKLYEKWRIRLLLFRNTITCTRSFFLPSDNSLCHTDIDGLS